MSALEQNMKGISVVRLDNSKGFFKWLNIIYVFNVVKKQKS